MIAQSGRLKAFFVISSKLKQAPPIKALDSAQADDSDLTICLNSGIDIASHLWSYQQRSYLGNPWDNTVSSEIVMTLIEMDRFDTSFAPSNIMGMLYPNYTLNSRILVGWIYEQLLVAERYEVLRDLVQACPAIFRENVIMPRSKEYFTASFISNVIVRCQMNVNALVSQKSSTLLMVACERQLVECVQLLLDAGADVNMQDLNQSTCLHYLARASQAVISNENASVRSNYTA